MRMAKSYTIDPEVSEYVDTTKGHRSASERVNELLKKGIIEERYSAFEAAANEFYSQESSEERAETKAIQKAAKRSLARG